jgi:hypothetical protein
MSLSRSSSRARTDPSCYRLVIVQTSDISISPPLPSRNHRLRRFTGVVAVVAALSGTAVAQASATPLDQRIADLRIVDVLGNQVKVAATPARLPTVLIFMSKNAKEASAAFARAVDERLIDRPVESFGIVDVRRYSGMLRNLATSYLKRSAEEAKVRRRERREQRGVDASPAAVDRWHLVGDFEGALFSRFGVEAEPKQPLAFVVDAAGALHGPFREVEPIVAALSTTSASTAPSPAAR